MPQYQKKKDTIHLTDYTMRDVIEIYKIADELQSTDKYKNFLAGKTVVMFFPGSSIRTRLSFEKGICLLGGQTVIFPPETLDKKEDVIDVTGYLNNWADVVIIRHKDIKLIQKVAAYGEFPVINAMTDINHPCEMLADLYSLAKIRKDFLTCNYLFAGAKGNIGLAWKEASDLFGINLKQCCPLGYEIEGLETSCDLEEAIKGIDIVCTDSLSSTALADFNKFQITRDIMERANQNALLNPCPPFYRGEEVSEDVINSEYFVGYEFKKYLLEIQQAVIIYNLI